MLYEIAFKILRTGKHTPAPALRAPSPPLTGGEGRGEGALCQIVWCLPRLLSQFDCKLVLY
jgi:hypothetical protein